MTATSKDVTYSLTDSLSLTGLQWGQEGAPVIIALHGWLDNAASFIHLAPLLTGCKVIAIDLPGHGYSCHFNDGDSYLLTHQLRWLHAFLESLPYSKVVLLGHSMGAALVSLYVSSFNDKVQGWIALDGLGSLTEGLSLFSSRLRRATLAMNQYRQRCGKAYRLPSGAQLIVPRHEAGYTTIDEMVGRRAKLNGVEPALIRPLVERAVHRCDQRYHWSFDRQLLLPSPVYLTESQNLTLINNITLPGLVIMAEQGWIYSTPIFQQRWSQLTNAQLNLIKGGHHQHLSMAPEVAACINAWLPRVLA